MDSIDEFASTLLEEAKRFYEKGTDASDASEREAFFHAAVLVAFSSLEAHINSVADEISGRATTSVHERGILLEQRVELVKGEFILKGNALQISRLLDRTMLLHRLGMDPNVDGPWVSDLKVATDLRNKLTHPKDAAPISPEAVRAVIEAVIKTIDELYLAVYRKGFPAASRQLQSKLTF